MSNNTQEIPEIIDIQLTLRACKPLGNGRKGWEPPHELKYNWTSGLATLKGIIERKVQETVPSFQQGNSTVFFYQGATASGDRMNVALWTHQQDVYLKPKNDSAQKSYERLTNENFGLLLKTCWSREKTPRKYPAAI